MPLKYLFVPLIKLFVDDGLFLHLKHPFYNPVCIMSALFGILFKVYQVLEIRYFLKPDMSMAT